MHCGLIGNGLKSLRWIMVPQTIGSKLDHHLIVLIIAQTKKNGKVLKQEVHLMGFSRFQFRRKRKKEKELLLSLWLESTPNHKRVAAFRSNNFQHLINRVTSLPFPDLSVPLYGLQNTTPFLKCLRREGLKDAERHLGRRQRNVRANNECF